jgi:DNA adenine methylase
VSEYDRAPFPWFGGKSKAAGLIWSRLGADCRNYVEPFLGSAAIWLNRPAEFRGWCTLNDLDGNVVNFWRSIRLSPEATARAADQPVFEADLHARHIALVTRVAGLSARLMAAPDYHEPELAGWWAWGACVWIGSGWCDGSGPWGVVDGPDGVSVFGKRTAGTGVNRQLPHLGPGTGVNRQLPHLGPGTGTDGLTEAYTDRAVAWFTALQDHFREARIACGDWSRIMSPGTMTRNGVCAVVLDPPYSTTEAVYARDCSTVAGAVSAWAEANGGNPLLRIALCGHDGEHNRLLDCGWAVETWNKSGGYQGADDRERIWFSPNCLSGAEPGLF